MRSREINKLIKGFKGFREKYYSGTEESEYSKRFDGQAPKTLLIGCSDSRVDPALLYSTSPGELFVVRNVANLVPPYEASGTGRHGVSAAIEFAVVNLKVENIVILGHRQCGGIRALMSGQQEKEVSFVGAWMEVAQAARTKVLQKFSNLDYESQCKECEKEAITVSIQNIKTFPFVKQAINASHLNIIGIYFDLEHGTLMEYDEGTQSFNTLKIS